MRYVLEAHEDLYRQNIRLRQIVDTLAPDKTDTDLERELSQFQLDMAQVVGLAYFQSQVRMLHEAAEDSSVKPSDFPALPKATPQTESE
jgi:hypothetical protein